MPFELIELLRKNGMIRGSKTRRLSTEHHWFSLLVPTNILTSPETGCCTTPIHLSPGEVKTDLMCLCSRHKNRKQLLVNIKFEQFASPTATCVRTFGRNTGNSVAGSCSAYAGLEMAVGSSGEDSQRKTKRSTRRRSERPYKKGNRLEVTLHWHINHFPLLDMQTVTSLEVTVVLGFQHTIGRCWSKYSQKKNAH
jgi:hypothetical protein